ncbi:MAG: ABC transporter substrate-binding protein [Acidimicrobiales bacterium]|jgi:ABC-type transport system substrate-binding protein|nr:ABC transporter substrate-binding protein [Acidimicrobiales bacterium]
MPSRPPHRRVLPALIAVVLALSLVGAACGSGDEEADDGEGQSASQGTAPEVQVPTDVEQATYGGELRFAVGADGNGWDPARSNFALDQNTVASSIYDTLMTFDGDGNLIPNLAESVEVSDDGLTYTITIPGDISFHDGTPLDAEAVALNITKRKASPLSGQALAPLETATAVDDTTVEVTMSTPWFGWDYTLAAQGGYVAAPSTLEDADGPQNPVGTGPFVFESWTTGDEVVVTRNEDYWKTADNGDQLPYLSGITFKVIVDPAARRTALEAGDVQGILTANAETITALQEEDGFKVATDVANEENFVMLNEGQPPFDNANARKALMYATDQEAIIDLLGGTDLFLPAASPYSEGERWYSESAAEAYEGFDPDKVEEALAAYTAETGQETLSFQLKAPSGEQQRVAEGLQGLWQAYGIDAEIVPVEQASFIGQAAVSNFQAAMFRNFAYVFPDSNYIFWHSSNANGVGTLSINFTQTQIPEVDAALDAGRATQDEDELAAAYETVQTGLNQEIPYLWLYHQTWAIITADSVGGLGPAAEIGFARQDGKPWWGGVFLSEG